MHIPDGFISPKTYLPAYVAALPLWTVALRRIRSSLDERTIPMMGVMTAVVFIFMSLSLPLPGGGSAHATGAAILALLFGVWTGFLAITLVLLLQALLLGAGGITTLAINALAIGCVGSLSAVAIFHALRRIHEGAALVLAGWFSVVLPALLVAGVLGLQPWLDPGGTTSPHYFPFGFSVTLPAVVLPHMLIGIGEGMLTLFLYRLMSRYPGRRMP